MQTYPFLTPEWIEAAKSLRNQHPAPSSKVSPLKINLVITNIPFSQEPIHAYLDTTSGKPELDLGELQKADVTLTTDYQTAKQIFIEGDMSHALNALTKGNIKIDGSIFKLMGLANLKDATPEELKKAIQEITE